MLTLLEKAESHESTQESTSATVDDQQEHSLAQLNLVCWIHQKVTLCIVYCALDNTWQTLV